MLQSLLYIVLGVHLNRLITIKNVAITLNSTWSPPQPLVTLKYVAITFSTWTPPQPFGYPKIHMLQSLLTVLGVHINRLVTLKDVAITLLQYLESTSTVWLP